MSNINIILIIIALIVGVVLIVQRTKHIQGNSFMNRTFAIIKPHIVKEKNTGKIIDIIESNNFDIIAMKKILITPEQAKKFYAIHKERPFFNELIENITNGPVVVMVLEKPEAVPAWRNLMGTTDPAKADEGTIRKKFGKNIGLNAVHGSDSLENARIEIEQFFPDLV